MYKVKGTDIDKLHEPILLGVGIESMESTTIKFELVFDRGQELDSWRETQDGVGVFIERHWRGEK
jgi:hypothetical protein